LLKEVRRPHQVLNAKQHERESRVVAQAGRKGAVTVADHMAAAARTFCSAATPSQMTRDHFLKKQAGHAVRAAPAVIPAEPAPGEAAQPTVQMIFSSMRQKSFRCPRDQWKPVYEQFANSAKPSTTKWWRLADCTPRHRTPRSARIDNQLRGRAGRQGDPGSSRFSFRSKTT